MILLLVLAQLVHDIHSFAPGAFESATGTGTTSHRRILRCTGCSTQQSHFYRSVNARKDYNLQEETGEGGNGSTDHCNKERQNNHDEDKERICLREQS